MERGSSAVECSREPGFESLLLPFQCLDIFFLRDAPVHSAVVGGGNVNEYSSRVIAMWLECLPEKSSWCRNEQVCQRVKLKAL